MTFYIDIGSFATGIVAGIFIFILFIVLVSGIMQRSRGKQLAK